MQMTQLGQSVLAQDLPGRGHLGISHKMPKATGDYARKLESCINSSLTGKFYRM